MSRTPLTRIPTAALLCGLCLAATPRVASADGLLTGFVGVNFGGRTESNKTTVGGALGVVSGSGLGFEVDFGYTPGFFDENEAVTKLNVATLMGNVVFAAPPGGAGIRPYISGGGGLLRTSASSPGDVFDDLSRNSFGVNAGAGLMLFFGESVALRGDLRYFRSLRDADEDEGFAELDLADFDYWRGTVGMTLKF